MYTLEELQDKTFKELKAIGWQFNALPDGDKRCRQNWVDAIAGVLPPLLELLEAAPADFDSPGAIEVQRQEPIAQLPETAPSVKDIQQNNAEPNGTGTEQRGTDEIAIGAVIHQQCLNTAQPDGDISSLEAETLGNQTCDRVLAKARDGQAVERRPLSRKPDELTATFNDEKPPNRGDNGRDRLESQPTLSQSAIVQAAKNSSSAKRSKSSTAHQLLELFKSSVHVGEPPIEHSPGVEVESVSEPIEHSPGVTFSPRFLALYSPPQPGNIYYKSDSNGQLSLLDFEIEVADEPPDPDDFDCMFAFWAAYDAWDARTDECEQFSEYCHPFELPVSSMRIEESAETIETVSSTSESSSTGGEFLIPVFAEGAESDDEPPSAGVGVRRPPPPPPSFGPVMVVAGDRSTIKRFARFAIPLSGRAPPGGDALPCA